MNSDTTLMHFRRLYPVRSYCRAAIVAAEPILAALAAEVSEYLIALKSTIALISKFTCR